MDVSNLINYYNTLFGIEVAIFGITSAVIFVFIQLLFSAYSYKHILHLIKDKWLLLYFFSSLLVLLMTSLASYFLSVLHRDIVPGINFHTSVVESPIYAFICLLLIFFSAICFSIAMIKDLSYLNPSRALFLLSQGINYSDISKYLWKKYPLEIPFALRMNIVIKFVDFSKRKSEKTSKSQIGKNEKKRKIELERVEKIIEKINKQSLYAEDPYRPLRDMMIQFIKKSDLSSLEEATTLINGTYDNFLRELPTKSKTWTPEENLLASYIKHIIEIFDTLLEVSDKEGLESAKKIILKSSFELANKLFDYKKLEEVDVLGEWWQKIADRAIGSSGLIFQAIMNNYKEIGKNYFSLLKKETKKDEGKVERLIDNLFRYIGWLGERLLIKVPFEEEPLFRNHSYSTEYDEYYNCLMAFEDDYQRDYPNLYPLIYFDALNVVMRRLIKIFSKDNTSNLDTNIFSIAYAFYSFAESAMKAANSRGAALAALNLKETYQELKRAGLDKNAKDIASLVIELGMQASSYTDQLEGIDFMSEGIDEWAINLLSEVGDEIEGQVTEAYIKSTGLDHDGVWSFVTRLGKKMGTNFGLMFDHTTGELYAEDDPRRR